MENIAEKSKEENGSLSDSVSTLSSSTSSSKTSSKGSMGKHCPLGRPFRKAQMTTKDDVNKYDSNISGLTFFLSSFIIPHHLNFMVEEMRKKGKEN